MVSSYIFYNLGMIRMHDMSSDKLMNRVLSTGFYFIYEFTHALSYYLF